MHSWGDENVDWEGIESAAEYIAKFISRWGRIRVSQWKEKFGTVRVYCGFGWECLYSIIWPTHVYIAKWWPYKLDLTISRWIMPRLSTLIYQYQVKIYILAYQRAVKKWPHIREEIICYADYPELLDSQGV